METIKQFAADNPELVGILASTVVWPVVTGLISMAQGFLSEKFPRAWAVMQASGLDLPGAAKALRGAKK